MSQISARFYVSEITTFATVPFGASAKIKLNPAYANGANKAWAVATPSGLIKLQVQNPDAIAQFKSWQEGGKDIHITFDEVVPDPA